MPSLARSRKRILVSVLGVGGQAARHIALINSDPLTELQHVYHPDPDRAGASGHQDLPMTSVLGDCLESDAIVIASPTSAHLAQLEALADYNGYILIEKPAVDNRSDVTALLNFPGDWKSRVRVNFNFQFNPVAEIFKKVLEDNLIGKPIHATFETNHGGAFKPDWDNTWRTSDRFAGPLYTVGIHYVQWLTTRFGNLAQISTHTANHARRSADDSGVAQLIWNDGFVATVVTSYASAFRVNFQITGTDGYVVYDGMDVKLFAPRETFDNRGFFTHPPESVLASLPWNDAYPDSVEKSQHAFMDLVRTDAKIDPAEFDRDVQMMNFLLGDVQD